MILITAFEPFGKYEKNPSITVASKLAGKNRKTITVPVTYSDARAIPQKVMTNEIEGVLSIGFAPSRKQLSIEAVAINFMHSLLPDNKGVLAKMEKIYADGAPAYFSPIPPAKIVNAWNDAKIPGYISESAGAYVCNTLFYSFLYYRDKMKLNTPMVFMHIPPDESMGLKNPGIAYVEQSTMVKAAEIIITFLMKNK